MNTVTITSYPCPKCGVRATFRITKAGYEAWREGEHIQNALPELTPSDREQLMTGYCPKCWDIIFGTEDATRG